jgi:tight adherence protein C
MSLAPVLAATAVLLAAAAGRELLAAGSGRSQLARLAPRLHSRSLAAALRLGVPERIDRAGLADRVPVPAVLLAKPATAALGALAALAAAPAAPGRTALVVLVGLPAAGFLLPDALLERSARRRHRHLVTALPDALDLLAVSVAAGRSAPAGFAQLAEVAGGPLARELGVVVAEVGCGVPIDRALARLRKRVPGSELATLCAALERSRRLGSPLAEQLRRQAGSLRRDQGRRTEERAARAAPKIQLVVALVLVPSVLLMIVAGLVANSDRLLGGL